MPDTVLVADIGGTNARLALAEFTNDAVAVRDIQRYLAEDYKSMSDAADAYLQSVSQRPSVACFAVAGPVTGDVIEFTNSSWVLDVKETMAALSLKRLDVVNDFEALAYGVLRRRPEDIVAVKEGSPDPDAPALVIGPGTGVGQALIVPCEGHDKVIPTEGGHVAFAPQTDEELAVWQFIAREHKRVSVERLLSGQGLVNIHRALCAINGRQAVALKPEEITHAAIAGERSMTVKTVAMFCEILGGVAGDAVLATGARGGVFLGGGILPKIRDIFLASRFVERFCDKGRMRKYVEDVPVDLIVSDGMALLGAGVVLSERLRER